MKTTILFMAILFASLTASSQVSFAISAGYNSRKCPNMGAVVQYNIGNIFIAGGLDGMIGKKISQGALFYSRIGYSILLSRDYSLEPAIGWGSDYKSSEDKALNKQGGLGSLYVVRQLSNENGSLIGGVTVMNKLVLASVGIRFSFIRGGNGRAGCPASW